MEEVIVFKLLEFLKEDAPYGDVTTETIIPENCIAEAVVINNDDCVVAGNKFIVPFLKTLNIEILEYVNDGMYAKKGTAILKVCGRAKEILLSERTILNFLSHLSGIATYTRYIVEKVKKVNPKVKIAATRKLLPGLGFFEKYGVSVGGGDTHRFGLSDMVLIKDNHIAILGNVEKAVRIAKEKVSFSKKIEVEVENAEDALIAAKAGADVIMLDNMKREEVERALALLKESGFRSKVIVEVSGGIDEKKILEFAKLDVDVISFSKITMNAPPIDLSLDIVKVKK
ncbi:MAG: hypothetical protein PWQ22_620 [Archaeoglobaceae archaeon]|nr:hypothetical protein [Archaeoglobaceae archaeon]MDK2876210.1 hypothetical protein [Archaeoglobaceae archaeon]